MDDVTALLAAADAHPTDATPLAVLADYYDDHGDAAKATAARLAAKAMTEPAKIGPKEYRVRYVERVGRLPRFLITARFPGEFRHQKRGGDCTACDSATYVVHAFEFWIAEDAKKAAARKAKGDRKRELQAAWVNPYAVGDVLYNSWGYEQTNIDFVQVVKVGPKSVTVRKIGKLSRPTGHMSANVSPDRGNFTGEPRVIKFSFRVCYDGTLSADLPAGRGSWSPVGDREAFTETSYA